MSSLGAIVRARLRGTLNRLRGLRRESRLKLAAEIIVGGGLWWALYAASARSLRFLARFPDLREEVVYTTLGLLFMALTVLLIFSNAVIALGSLFRSAETAFLLASPAPAGSVYAYKTLEGLVFSSWAFLIMGLPPILAYGVDVGAPASYYIGIPVFFVPFTVITASVGTLAGLVLTGLVPRHRGKFAAGLFAAFVAAGLLVAIRVASTYRGAGLAFGELWKEEVLGHLAFLRNRHLPHSWLTRGMLALASGRTADALVPFAATASTAVFAYLLGDFVARRTYRAAWSAAAGGRGARRARMSVVASVLAAATSFAGRTASLFVWKDVRLFLRDPTQWSQMAIFFGLLGIYILNLRNLHYDYSRGFWLYLVSTLNLGATSLTLATLTTRFVFPQMSLEGRRFWVLGLAPTRRREILYGKFAFSLSGALVVAETLVLLSNYMLRMPRDVLLAQVAATALVCTGLTGLAVGMGAIFPDYRETNASRIVSGFGGTLTLILSVLFVVAVVAAVAVPSHVRLVEAAIGPRAYLRWAGGALASACALTALAAGLPLAWGARSLERAEF